MCQQEFRISRVDRRIFAEIGRKKKGIKGKTRNNEEKHPETRGCEKLQMVPEKHVLVKNFLFCKSNSYNKFKFFSGKNS